MFGLSVEDINRAIMKDNNVNAIYLAAAIGQLHPDFDLWSHLNCLMYYAKRFNEWERKNVLCLPNGWEDYTLNGGSDYESVIYEWAKGFK